MNHTTNTTVLIAIAAVAATLLAAGTVAAAVGSNDSALAHRKKAYKETRSDDISHGAGNTQIILCITYGDESPNMCSNALSIPWSSPMKQGSSYTPHAAQQSSPMKPSPTTTTSTPNVVHTSGPMKSSTSDLGGSYPSVAPKQPSTATTTSTPNVMHTSGPMKSGTTGTPLKFNSPIKFPFDLFG
jgi:hypothetical protein